MVFDVTEGRNRQEESAAISTAMDVIKAYKKEQPNIEKADISALNRMLKERLSNCGINPGAVYVTTTDKYEEEPQYEVVVTGRKHGRFMYGAVPIPEEHLPWR